MFLNINVNLKLTVQKKLMTLHIALGTSQAFSSIELPGVLPRQREIDT